MAAMNRRAKTARGGRPSGYTVPAVLGLVAGVRAGLDLDDAAKAAGVGRSTLFRWLKAGRAGDPEFAPLVQAIAQAGKDRKAEWNEAWRVKREAEREKRARAARLGRYGWP